MVGEPLRVPLSLCDFEGLAVERGLPRVTDTRFVSFELAQIQVRTKPHPNPNPFPTLALTLVSLPDLSLTIPVAPPDPSP